MKPVILLATFAVGVMTAAAQQPGPSFGVAGMEAPPSAGISVDPFTAAILQSAACPVGLKASFNSRSQMVKVGKAGEPDPGPDRRPSQHIRVVVEDPAHQAISSATVTAYGLTARTRMDRSADPFAIGASGVRRTMTVSLVAGANGALYADLRLPGFTAVQQVKLESIRFANGSTHSFAGKTLCSVPVDPVLLVSGR
ncbi:MAG TPA: hypothetical protein VFE01_01175 [Terracidiphilus sp.]|jgi:hypothetical protein|nr:hypothetical protein [Terracidiphilus sp.]